MENMRGAFVNPRASAATTLQDFLCRPSRPNTCWKCGGAKALAAAKQHQETTEQTAQAYNHAADDGEIAPIYRFGEGVLEGDDLTITDHEIIVPGFGQKIALAEANPFEDMT